MLVYISNRINGLWSVGEYKCSNMNKISTWMSLLAYTDVFTPTQLPILKLYVGKRRIEKKGEMEKENEAARKGRGCFVLLGVCARWWRAGKIRHSKWKENCADRRVKKIDVLDFMKFGCEVSGPIFKHEWGQSCGLDCWSKPRNSVFACQSPRKLKCSVATVRIWSKEARQVIFGSVARFFRWFTCWKHQSTSTCQESLLESRWLFICESISLFRLPLRWDIWTV